MIAHANRLCLGLPCLRPGRFCGSQVGPAGRIELFYDDIIPPGSGAHECRTSDDPPVYRSGRTRRLTVDAEAGWTPITVDCYLPIK